SRASGGATLQPDRRGGAARPPYAVTHLHATRVVGRVHRFEPRGHSGGEGRWVPLRAAPRLRLHHVCLTPDGEGRRGARARSPGGRPDRKSTRLNSSHVAISYAVFCLKKKNKTPNTSQ